MKTVSSHILRLTGKAELPKEVQMGNNYSVALSGAIPKVEEHDNEDGTINRIYPFKAIKVELLNSLGETLQPKDTRSKSQILRARMYSIWKNNDIPGDFDSFYEKIMNNLIYAADDVANMYGK